MQCLGENTITDLVDALLAPEERARVEAHTASCDACRRLISELVRRTGAGGADAGDLALGSPDRVADRDLPPGTAVGRYVIRRALGSGATGTVFEAFDPELERAIALKLLHPAHAQRERIQREARALARLAHPNVVAAYDAGAFEGELFVAMELVDGGSLRAWMQAPRSTEDILDVFGQIGRGLAAAHAAGLVHRDVKPDNAIVGRDGRVRVVDFGLAAGRDGGTELVGTPAYMAPEQLERGGADAASDQFAYCVALHEALYGERPFPVNLTDEVARGIPAPAAGARAVPAQVCAALARGLAVAPDARHPSMDALVAALDGAGAGSRSRRRRRAFAVAGVALGGALVAGAVFAAARAGAPAQDPALCGDAAPAFAAVWSFPRAASIHARFTATGAAFAEGAWASVERGFARFGERWVSTRTEACEATRVRGAQSDQLLTLRTRCLDRALAEADALATVLAAVTPGTIAQAPAAVDGLPALDECSNATALLAPVPPPSPRDAPAVAAIEGELARGRALRDAQRWVDAIAVAESAVAAARTLRHEPTRAAALFLLGEAQAGAGPAAPAEATLREAFAAAETGRDDLLAARVAVELVYVVGQLETRLDDGLEWAFHADTSLKRIGGDLELSARLSSNVGSIRYAQADYKTAREHFERALALREQLHGPSHRATAAVLANLGRAVMAEGDNPKGLELTARAAAILEQVLGPAHPDVALALTMMGSVQHNQGKYAEARATYERALAIAEPALGPTHYRVGAVLISLGYTLHELGRPADAIAVQRRAIAIFDRPGGDPRQVASALSGLGDSQLWLGRPADALASYSRALALREAINPDGDEVPSSLENVATALLELGRPDDALAHSRRALALREKISEPDYFENAYAHTGIGEAELRRGHPAAAVPSLRTAVRLLEAYDGDPITLAATRFLLAQALRRAGRDPREAREALALANAAEPVLAGAGAQAAKTLAELRAWKQVR